ncbi:MAG: DUF167 domain-containing protein [Nanoarchaeota archaeon]
MLPDRFAAIIKPSSPRSELLGFDETRKAYRIAIKAPPEDGKANKELLKFLKKETGKQAEIVSGFTSHLKRIRLL